MKPGIYFGMPEDEYHADPALSASGIKLLNISPLDYWVESAMNPDREESDTSDAKTLGKAYHCLILEGRAAFDARYAVAPDRADYPDAIGGGEGLREACKDRGLKANGSIAEMCARIREADAVVELWPEIEAEFAKQAGERDVLTKKQYRDLRLVEIVLARMPSAKGVFQDGRPEVSIFWEREGVPMKARLDFLHPRAVVDLKSFANVMSKEVEAAVAGEISRCRYFIQPAVYLPAVDAAKRMFAEHGMACIFGDEPPLEWLRRTLDPKTRHRFYFVFVQTGGRPNVVIREWAQFEKFSGLGMSPNAYWHRGEAELRNGVALYRKCMAEFGPGEPWIADFGLRAFSDEDFPVWSLTAPREVA